MEETLKSFKKEKERYSEEETDDIKREVQASLPLPQSLEDVKMESDSALLRLEQLETNGSATDTDCQEV